MNRMAIVFNSDFCSWPMGGMLAYVHNILPYLTKEFDIDLWGCEVDQKEPHTLKICDKEYLIRTNTKAKTKKKIIPNVVKCFWGNFINSNSLSNAGFDVLYFHLSASALGWLLGDFVKHPLKKKKRPLVVLHQHGMAYGNKIGDRLNYLAMNHVDLVFFTTDKNGLELHRKNIRNKNLCWMPSMVDTEYFHPLNLIDKDTVRKELRIPADKKVFIYTGRITSWKNPMLLLDAFQEYQDKNDNNGFLIYVGDGDMLQEVKDHAKSMQCSESVLLAGRQSKEKIRTYLQASDVFVLPTNGEGSSVSTLEAMAVNLPVVSFNVQGMGDIVSPESGILIANKETEALARGMEFVVKNIDGFKARCIAKQYGCDTVCKRLVEVIQDYLLENGKLS